MEVIQLTTPIVEPQRVTTDFRVSAIALDWDQQFILARFTGTLGERREWRVEGADAVTLMVQLNKANLTVKSLHKHCMERAIAAGVFDGSISGTPA